MDEERALLEYPVELFISFGISAVSLFGWFSDLSFGA